MNQQRFRKSSRCEQGTCVELARTGPGAAVRDSKNRTGPVLTLADAVLLPFIQRLKAGALDPPG